MDRIRLGRLSRARPVAPIRLLLSIFEITKVERKATVRQWLEMKRIDKDYVQYKKNLFLVVSSIFLVDI